uniref:SDR family oxidoreductase n=1 Tax=uncultured Helicobacter sp. TaxID=175537 RepID=A0A650EL28_9HELI|nr:SDR family oxidoreductase [uncultured Helicobacter sp.]
MNIEKIRANYQRIAITGASSGIGKEIALYLASPQTSLYLTGRDTQRLADIKESCVNQGAKVQENTFDVRNESACQQWCEDIFQERVDLLIINAGMALGEDESANQQIQVAQTNVMGVANIVFYALEKMQQQEKIKGYRGQIVLIASIASLLAMPNAQSYSASKHFVRILGEALNLSYPDITITTICPGFITTPLTAHLAQWIPMMSAKQAARKILAASAKRKWLYIFPFWLGFAARFYNLLPLCIKRYLCKILNIMGKL